MMHSKRASDVPVIRGGNVVVKLIPEDRMSERSVGVLFRECDADWNRSVQMVDVSVSQVRVENVTAFIYLEEK